MKGHTLMQAIARVNRIYPGKSLGLIVDYLNLFKSMKKALGEYANPDNEDEMVVKDIQAMLELLDNTIGETDKFCRELGIDFDNILEIDDVFPRISLFEEYLNILLDKDEYKEEFKIYSNLCRNIYDASKPEVFEIGWDNKYLSIILYLDDMIQAVVRDVNIENAKIELNRTLDLSVHENYFENLIDFVEDLKEEQQVKLSAKKLYEAITREDSGTKVIDWYKDEQPRQKVKSRVEEVLDTYLPDSYDKDIFNIKSDIIFTHIIEEAMMGNQYYAS